MSFKISNMPGLTKELTCTQCSKLLSVLPVYYCAATGNVCGRCATTLDWMISNGTLERAVAYEAVAKHLLFPCYNRPNGCTAELKWNQVEEHEKSCTHFILLCPFNAKVGTCVLQCAWKGCLGDLVSHLHTEHHYNMQVNPLSFIMDVLEANVHIFLVKVSEQTFIIFTKYIKETNKFYCGVMCCARNPENQFYRFQLELGRYNDYFLILRKSSTEPYVNMADIIDNYDKMITVDVASVESMLGDRNSIIYCKIGLVKKNKKELTALMEELKLPVEEVVKSPTPSSPVHTPTPTNSAPSTAAAKNPVPAKKPLAIATKNTLQPVKNPPKPPKFSKVKVNPPSNPSACANSSNSLPLEKAKVVRQLSKLDLQLLNELECPVCSNHMVAPIFICPTGHSLCSDCKDKVKVCPSCRQHIVNTRNFTLERLTTRVQYPCRFVDVGCTEILNSENIRIHENSCFYSNNKCPLKMLPSICNLKCDPADVIGHIRQKHAEFVAEVNQEYARNIKAQVTSSYYVAFYVGEIFIICCKHSASTGPIKFNFLHVGMKANQPKFRYELEFLDQTNKGMKLIVNQLCQVVPPKISTALTNCLTIPLEMLDPFIKESESTLFFKFHIQQL